jgi:hypothetical protein
MAVEAGELEVEQDGIGPGLLGDGDGCGAVIGTDDLMPFLPEQEGEGRGCIRVVFDHKYAQGEPGVWVRVSVPG